MFKVYDNNNGILNEKRFAEVLDKRLIKNLPVEFQKLIYALFNDRVTENDIVECWQSKFKEKADIKIKINEIVKGVSIKMGSGNSVHLEKLDTFCKFLTSIGVSNSSISILHEYIIGKINNKKIDNETYKQIKPKELKLINEELNDLYVKSNIIIRTLFKGTEINRYNADAIIHGTPNHFIWATKSEILKYLMFCHKRTASAISVGSLNIQSWNRNINFKNNDNENFVQIKWHMIKKDLNYLMATRGREITKKS